MPADPSDRGDSGGRPHAPVSTVPPDSTARPYRDGVPEHGRVPKSYAVKMRLLTLMDELGEDALLPSERELAAEYGVARSTLRSAIADLVMEGRLRSARGRGTYVAPPKLVQPLSLAGYTESVLSMGMRPGRRVVTVEHHVADADLAERLGIRAGDLTVHLERVLLADDEPVGLESTYLPLDRFPAILDVLRPDESLYRCLREQFGVVFAEADESVETVLAAPREAMLLGTNPALPMLLTMRTSYDPEGVPIERVRQLFRGDRIGFATRLRAGG
ncbi:MAG: GntR family transcriptional regulator [Streptomycetaceae bacterium]|nr:GntR family transcriptional regulator [Streptomycetaceae bacterium]